MARARVPPTPYYRFNSSPEVIRLVVIMYVQYPFSLKNVEDLLHERSIDVCYETVMQQRRPAEPWVGSFHLRRLHKGQHGN